VRNTTGSSSQWLLLEMRLCRASLGLSQREMADATCMGLQTVKNMEKSGANPRLSTLNKLRDAFRWMGVKFSLEGNGSTRQDYSEELMTAFDSGTLTEHLQDKIKLIKMANDQDDSGLTQGMEW